MNEKELFLEEVNEKLGKGIRREASEAIQTLRYFDTCPNHFWSGPNGDIYRMRVVDANKTLGRIRYSIKTLNK